MSIFTEAQPEPALQTVVPEPQTAVVEQKPIVIERAAISKPLSDAALVLNFHRLMLNENQGEDTKEQGQLQVIVFNRKEVKRSPTMLML